MQASVVSLFNLTVDQVLNGSETTYLDSCTISKGLREYKADRRSRNDPPGQTKIRIPIWDSLHFHFLRDPGRFGLLYENYVASSKQSEHSLRKFFEISKNFSVDRLIESPIEVENVGSGFQVLDGFHRLALYYWQTGHKVIPAEYLTSSYPIPEYPNLRTAQSRVLKALSRSKGARLKNGWAVRRELPSGYHGFSTFGLSLEGQRNNSLRVQTIDKTVKLFGRSVLDLGCHTGGLLYHMDGIARGVGVDLDKGSIKSAQFIQEEIHKISPEFARRYSFEVCDLSGNFEPLLSHHIADSKIDLIMLMSIGSWVSDWERLYSFVAQTQLPIVLETNNATEGQAQIALLAEAGLTVQLISEESLDDVTGNIGRQTFFLEHK